MYCLEAADRLVVPWMATTNLGCLTGTGGLVTIQDAVPPTSATRFYRVVEQRP